MTLAYDISHSPSSVAALETSYPPRPPLPFRPSKEPLTWRNEEHFRAALSRRGFEQIGSGGFSRVYAKPGSDTVVKVSRPMTPYNPLVDAWPAYIAWATYRGFLGTFAPNVTSLHFITGTDEAWFYVAAMERLVCTIEEARQRAIYSRAVSMYDAVCASRDEFRTLAHIKEHAPELARTLVTFCNDMTGAICDLGADDWMVRRDGSLVCVDPVSDVSLVHGNVCRRRFL